MKKQKSLEQVYSETIKIGNRRGKISEEQKAEFVEFKADIEKNPKLKQLLKDKTAEEMFCQTLALRLMLRSMGRP